MSDLEAAFLNSRRRLYGLAYRMLGSATDAEDVVQETYVRARREGGAEVRKPEALLMTIASRLCLDHLQSARARREVYVGPWLPEPIVETDGMTPETALALADDLSLALLMTLEKLDAAERAAFLLHDVFDMGFPEIADILERSEAACRQLASRARKAVRSDAPRRKATRDEHQAMLMKFARAVAEGGPEDLRALIADDAVLYSDGGGVVSAALNPIEGADKIARFFSGIEKKSAGIPRSVEMAVVNGAPGFLIFVAGRLEQTLSIDTDGDRITAIYVVRNPDKLGAVRASLSEEG
jgi:RNA polymerase sigma-70 factor (ECF subfamily)